MNSKSKSQAQIRLATGEKLRHETPRHDAVDAPSLLIIAGHDPSGGAGQIADVQAVTALGAHAAVALSCLTIQDTLNVSRVIPVAVDDVIAQARSVLADQRVACIKLGVLPTAELGMAVSVLLQSVSEIPVVVDPVLIASGGNPLAEAALKPVLAGPLAQAATVMTPNVPELRALTGETDPQRGAEQLLAAGAQAVLVTDGDGDVLGGATIRNMLFWLDAGSTQCQTWDWPRLRPSTGRPMSFHGTGCTLAAAIAAGLAHGGSVQDACEHAQRWVAQTLAAARSPGRGQSIPNRAVSLESMS